MPRLAFGAPVAAALRELGDDSGWGELLERLREVPGFWLLESSLAEPGLGRFSLAGADPYAVLRSRGARIEWRWRRAPGGAEAGSSLLPAPPRCSDPLEALRAVLPQLAPAAEGGAAAAAVPPPSHRRRTLRSVAGALSPELAPLVGGAVGGFSYELAHRLERLAPPPRDDLGWPDSFWMLVDWVLIRDLTAKRLRVAALGFGATSREARLRAERRAEALAAALRGRGQGTSAASWVDEPIRIGVGTPPSRTPPLRLRDTETGLELGAFFNARSYARAVEAIGTAIARGDLYQACLTHRLETSFAGDPWRLACQLARTNPAPFAAYFAFHDLHLVGSSPERFLRLDANGRVESRPIKGTRPRDPDPERDAALRAELARSLKDRAENVMIVDLVRNDLGRVCVPGSVAVPELFAVESYATVFQLVSTVSGRLVPGRDALDLVRAAFPPGSMTGAPKIAAIELLARLEPVRRGLYSGALGYLDVRGGMDLSVVIRTLFLAGGRAWFHVGGGIVADSDPEAEWLESLDKARALLRALAASETS